jgi:hypothetical protein
MIQYFGFRTDLSDSFLDNITAIMSVAMDASMTVSDLTWGAA